VLKYKRRSLFRCLGREIENESLFAVAQTVVERVYRQLEAVACIGRFAVVEYRSVCFILRNHADIQTAFFNIEQLSAFIRVVVPIHINVETFALVCLVLDVGTRVVRIVVVAFFVVHELMVRAVPFVFGHFSVDCRRNRALRNCVCFARA